MGVKEDAIACLNYNGTSVEKLIIALRYLPRTETVTYTASDYRKYTFFITGKSKCFELWTRFDDSPSFIIGSYYDKIASTTTPIKKDTSKCIII
jgi:hypothetical protein